MSTSTASSLSCSSTFSFSPASSLSSAPSSWSASLSYSHDLDLCAMVSDPSANTTSSRTAGSSSSSSASTPCIAALPSLAHSLSAFPTMTVVTNDMVHYGTLCRTKDASQAKLNSALRITKQRQVSTAPPGALAMMSSSPSSSSALAARAYTRYPTPEDEDPVLLLVPKRSKAKRSSSS